MAMRVILSLSFMALTLLLIQGVNSTKFMIKNMCQFPIYPGVLTAGGIAPIQPTGFKLKPGARRVLAAPPKWSGRMWARYHCKIDKGTGRFTCDSGDCGSGQLSCNNAGGSPPATLAEFTLNGADGKDFYDVSNVDGFNLPVSIVPSTSKCPSTTCATNLNAACPRALWQRAPDGKVVGCKSACLAFDTDQYCCRGAYAGGPQVCKPNKYAMYFKKGCPQAYSYAYDDGTSTFTCIGADYTITFCPRK